MIRYSNKIDAKWLQTIFKTAIYILHLYCLQFVFSLNKHFLQMYQRCISIQSCFQSRPEICSQTRPGIYLYSLLTVSAWQGPDLGPKLNLNRISLLLALTVSARQASLTGQLNIPFDRIILLFLLLCKIMFPVMFGP